MTAPSEPELANSALEFHDSEVSSIEAVVGGIQVYFAAAHVHRSNGTPGVNAGKGYAQAVELRLGEAATFTCNLHECVGRLSDGELRIGDSLVNLIPLPFEGTGMVTLNLQFSSGTVFSAQGTSVNVSQTGSSRFVENFAC
jgi:hypothetical protein